MTRPGLVGTRVDRYSVERLLGAGGFGTVYRARHVHTEAVVALKLLKRTLAAEPQLMERFLREAKAAAAVGDEHIVGVLDAGVAADGQGFLALEYLDGVDLKELAIREGPLPPMRLGLIALQVLGALKAAHARGIVHRDMKPANVFILRRKDERGVERDFAKVLDFGISKVHAEGKEQGLTMTGVAMGTPAYMAPEQFFDARGVDARADVYSVAVMLYELLGHRLPFDADSYAALVVRVKTEEPSPLLEIAPEVPRALAEAVMRGLAKAKEQRWQSAADFARALREALGLRSLDLATPVPGPASLPPPPAFTPSPPPSSPAAPSEPRSTGGAASSSAGRRPSQPAATTPQPFDESPFPAYTPEASASPSVGRAPPPPQAAASASGAAPRRDRTLRWALIALGLVFLAGGCCTCGYVARRAHQDDEQIIFHPAQAPTRARVVSRGPGDGSSRAGSAPASTAPSLAER